MQQPTITQESRSCIPSRLFVLIDRALLIIYSRSKHESIQSISAKRLNDPASNSHPKRKDHATSQNPIVLSDDGTEDTDSSSFTSDGVEGGNFLHTPHARSSPPVPCDTRRPHERTIPVEDDLRAAERAIPPDKPQLIHFSQDGPKNQGVLSKESTSRYTGSDRKPTTLATSQHRHPGGSAEEAMAEILSSGAKGYRATPVIPKVRDPAQRNILPNQLQPSRPRRQSFRTPSGALMPPPPLRRDGHRDIASNVVKAHTAENVPSSHETEVIMTDTIGTSTKQLSSSALGVPSKRLLHAEEKKDLTSYKRFKVMADVSALRQPLSSLHTLSLADTQRMIQTTALDKLAKGHNSVSSSRNVHRSHELRAPPSGNCVDIAKPAMPPSGAAFQTSSKVDTSERATGVEKVQPKRLSGKDSSQRPSIMLEGERRDNLRKSSQPRVTQDGSPVRQEQEERYSQRQQDIGETFDDELKGMDSADLFLATRDALREDDNGADMKGRVSLGHSESMPLVDVDTFDDGTSFASEDCSQIILHSGLDHYISDEIISQHNPLLIPEEDPFLVPERCVAEPCAVPKEQSQARPNDKSLLETLKSELLRVRQTQVGPAKFEEGEEETDIDKTLVEDIIGSAQSDNLVPSESSDESSNGSLKSEGIVGITNTMHGLGVHRRPLYQSIVRIGHELVRHLVDTETAIKDSIDDYYKDGELLLKQMEKSHKERLVYFVEDAKIAERHLHGDLRVTARRLAKDVKVVEVIHKQCMCQKGRQDDALEELDALLARYR